ncbi:MAG: SDR family NAD(P)-dependent oxidoreductase [Candidatus Shapirobacteria bacterium]|nr:SDR family NAD(P)-dependent oxidoreductase [Candidatus Shapirobacteria bacterium]MDD4410813.1 SDR family NAD(P)-dependent oxidoreductase [Candidatus Shapirobacteria bacterium]
MPKKVICITGGANGLGRELAAFFSRQAQVIIFDINETVLAAVAKKFTCDYQLCDVSDSDSVSDSIKKVFKKYGRIDCFINSAGLYIDGEIESNDPKLIKKVYEVNSLGPIFTAQTLVPFLKKQKFGTIININSTAGLHPKAFNSVYHSSKWALKGFFESVQPELASFGIKIVNICPGVMKTKFTDGTNCDLSKAMEPHQVVKAIDFILSLDSDTIISELTIKHL